MRQIFAITAKELKTYFGTPMASIFMGIFLLASLFSFFWIETFFARNLADIRPLFRWMPILMIFLCASLTMRQWSEEQKMGTLEILLTLPVRLHQLVLGKFLAVFLLISISLFLTLGLPLSVSMMGELDWGPVVGGYLGTLLMTGAYISLGLFISSRTDNQIVALMLSVLCGGCFYLIGSPGMTDFFDNRIADFFRSLGTGSRFTSIARGIIDLRDVIYYVSFIIFFLTANTYSLDRQRWSFGEKTSPYRRKAFIALLLLTLNILAVNIWMARINSARIDITTNNEYSLSPATLDLISTLTEPLVMEGYFSEKTHPLLSPLVPQIKDLMLEYQIASADKIRVSFTDPRQNEAMETKAGQHGIKPVPFQIAGRYEIAVVNSYFHILIKYGDQYVTLGFNDLIEAKPRPDGELEVRLRNLEYDLTKSIKKVLYGFQPLSSIFAQNPQGFKLISIFSKANQPESFQHLPLSIKKAVDELQKETGSGLTFEEIAVDDLPTFDQQSISERFNIEPIQASFFSNDSFYLHLLLESGTSRERIYLSPEMDDGDIRHEIEAALKRNGSGFTKTIGIWTPKTDTAAEMGMMQHGSSSVNYQIVQQLLRENYNLEEIDLSAERIQSDIDALLLMAPQDLSDLQILAVDQYLMRGGTVVALVGSYLLDLSPDAQSLQVRPVEKGIGELLSSYGVNVGSSLVMDRQNEPFPVPVNRDIGGMIIQEIQLVDYPFFVDVRPENMSAENKATASLPAVTMNWVSPIEVEPEKRDGKKVDILLRSSAESWLQDSPQIEPDFARFPQSGFAMSGEQGQHNLALTISGVFTSFFQGKLDPRLAGIQNEEEKETIIESETGGIDDPARERQPYLTPLLSKSPATAKLVVIGSSEFVSDTVISMSQGIGMDRFLNSLEFLQNIIDWSVEDEDLLTIRSRGSHAKILKPMSHKQQNFWEWFNYGVALAALFVVSIYGARRRRKESPFLLESRP